MRNLLILVVFLPLSSGVDWPAWRGAAGDGVVTKSAIPLKWSAESATWKTAIPGTGYSSPVIREDRIFLTAAGVNDTTDRTLVCLDLKSGDILWTQEIYQSPIEKMHRLNSPASSTPACDHERVYVTFCENGHIGVAAVNFRGDLLWKRRPGTFMSRHGFHSCPVIHDGRVIINGQQDGDDAFVAALDGRNGDVIWKTERPNKVRSFAAPFLLKVEDRIQVVVSGAGQTIAYDIETGSEVWQVTGPAEKTVSCMLTDGQRLFVPGGREDLLLAVDPGGRGDVTDTHITWSGKKGVPYVPSPVLANGLLHLVSDEGIYTVYEPDTGRVIRQARVAGRTSSSLLAVGKHILLTEDSGTTHVLKNDGSGTVVETNDVGETVYASHAVSGSRLLIRGTDHLFCFMPSKP